uniref:Ig-like domain-containing protein n=1 Tax=Oryzias latipes TaxID=8090 RepID=A0A3P9ICY0_ORYLA
MLRTTPTSCSPSVSLQIRSSKVVCSPSTVQAHLGQDVVLSCRVEPPYDLTLEALEWKHGTDVVHVYRSRKDDPDNQDPRFKGRTILNHQNLKDGNVSLTLTNVTKKDEGNYIFCLPKQVMCSNVTLTVAWSGHIYNTPCGPSFFPAGEAGGPCLAPPWTNRGPGGWLPEVRSGSPLGGPGSYLGLGRGDARNSWVVVGCSSGAVGVLLRWGPALGSPGAAGGLLSWLGWGGALFPSVPPCSLALGALRRPCWPWPGWRAWSPGRRLFPAGSRVALGGFRLPLLVRWGSWCGDGGALSLLLFTLHHPF